MPEGRPTTARGRARREQLLDVGLDAFGAQGYRGTSLSAIAEAVGISEPGLLHHFPSKQALLLGVLERHEALHRERMRAQVEAAGGSIMAAFVDLAQQHEADPRFIRLFTMLAAESVDPSHPAHDWFVARFRRVRTAVAARIEEGQQLGRIDAELDPELLARLVLALLDGLELQHLLEPTEAGISGPLRALLERLR
jgi:AcrR family transcriptional regulator